MEIKNAIARVEKVQSLLFVIADVQDGLMVTAVKGLRALTGLSIREAAASLAIARGEESQGKASEEAREIGLLLKKFL